ncbi:MAG: hypothetical protein NPIRA01_28880 [Nitrospirales bacterium]|nr:MAG: hypothetical protein NPIRA01_28880 [Nitrospirales bacterium]
MNDYIFTLESSQLTEFDHHTDKYWLSSHGHSGDGLIDIHNRNPHNLGFAPMIYEGDYYCVNDLQAAIKS